MPPLTSDVFESLFRHTGYAFILVAFVWDLTRGEPDAAERRWRSWTQRALNIFGVLAAIAWPIAWFVHFRHEVPEFTWTYFLSGFWGAAGAFAAASILEPGRPYRRGRFAEKQHPPEA